MNRQCRVFVLVLGVYGFNLALPNLFAAEGPVVTTSICELAKNPENYSNKMVRVRAFILSDLRHTTILVDHGCEKVGVSLESGEWENRPIELVKDKSYDQLEALHPRLIELRDKGQMVYGTFEGLYQWNPNKKPLRELVLRSVSDLWIGKHDDPKYTLQNK